MTFNYEAMCMKWYWELVIACSYYIDWKDHNNSKQLHNFSLTIQPSDQYLFTPPPFSEQGKMVLPSTLANN